MKAVCSLRFSTVPGLQGLKNSPWYGQPITSGFELFQGLQKGFPVGYQAASWGAFVSAAVAGGVLLLVTDLRASALLMGWS